MHGAFTSRVLATSLGAFELLDRAFITDLCYGTLRQLTYLDTCLRPHLKRPNHLPEDVLNSLRAASYELLIRKTPRHAAVNEWVQVIKTRYGRLAGLVNAVLRKVEAVEAPPALRYSIPDWLFQDWLGLFGDEAALVAEGMLEPEPLWLSSYHPEAKQSLLLDGSVSAGPLPDTLAIKPAKPLTQLEAFKRGWVQAQNPSSTLPVRLLEPARGERILDLASGLGIKAAQLAAAGARPVCLELDPKKVEAAKKNLARLGFEVEHVVIDLTQVTRLEPADKVLLDAPCSGTGTLRGHPEIKLHLQPEKVQRLAELQAKMLDTAAALTRPGGRLVYAVCALTRLEGTGQIARFLDRQPDFKPVVFAPVLPQCQTDCGAYILPVAGLDGFFISLLERTA